MISFYYVEENRGKLQKMIRLSIKVVGVIGGFALIGSLAMTEPLVTDMLVLPELFGVTGVWLATPAAELAAICQAIFFFVKYRY